VTLDESAGTGLFETSPHCSDNSHSKLYETMLVEYALGTTWYDKVSLKRYINTETYLLFIHLWALIARVNKKAILWLYNVILRFKI
jgi:hypothetical protein